MIPRCFHLRHAPHILPASCFRVKSCLLGPHCLISCELHGDWAARATHAVLLLLFTHSWCNCCCKWLASGAVCATDLWLGLQLKSSREVSPTTEIRINGEAINSSAQQASPAGGAASYGASTMGITIQPSQPAPAAAAAHSDDDSMGDSSPSRSGSPAREAAPPSTANAQEQAQQLPADAFAAAAAPALPKQQAVLTPQRVSMLRGGHVAGAYSDGRYSCLAVC